MDHIIITHIPEISIWITLPSAHDVCDLRLQGILCMGVLKRARQKKETTRDQAINDLEVLVLLPRFSSLF